MDEKSDCTSECNMHNRNRKRECSMAQNERNPDVKSAKPVQNSPFPNSCLPPLQSESKCEVFLMKISFQSYVK